MQRLDLLREAEDEVKHVRDARPHVSPHHPAGTGRLPTFLLIGAAKAGTTSLYEYLKQHPQIFMSPLKEPNYLAYGDGNIDFGNANDNKFLNRVAVKDVASYKRLFAGATDEQAAGEASGSSLYMPGAHRRIWALVPEAKLIAVLREPSERAYSQFLYYRGLGTERIRHFDRALSLEARRIDKKWAPYWFYTANGFYYRQLRPFYDTFGRDRIRVYLYDDLVDDPARLMTEMFRFLEVDDSFHVDVAKKHNVSHIPINRIPDALRRVWPTWNAISPITPSPVKRAVQRLNRSLVQRYVVKAPPMSEDVRRTLKTLFREDVTRLQGLIERDLSHWLV